MNDLTCSQKSIIQHPFCKAHDRVVEGTFEFVELTACMTYCIR